MADPTPAERLIAGARQPLALAPFDSWTYDTAAALVRDTLHEDYGIRKAYAVDKDHFQNGEEWVGPGDATSNEKIALQFAPEDAVGEVLSNISNAFAEPQITCVPLEDVPTGREIPPVVQARMDEAQALITGWWDKMRMQEHIQERQKTAAWAGQAGLRLWIPWRFLEKQGDTVFLKQTSDMAEAISYVRVKAPYPEYGMILTDADTQEQVAVFLDEEVTYTGPERTKEVFKRAELLYLDPNRTSDTDCDTIQRLVYSDPSKPALTARLPLGGRLLFAEMRATVLLSEPVLRTQRQLNFIATVITRLVETAGFRERYMKNARPQGYRTRYTEGDSVPDGAYLERDDENVQWLVTPVTRTLGANTTTELVGLPKLDPATGDFKGYETPDVVIGDPVDPKPSLEATDSVRRRILRMCAQGHLGGISNAEASGIAYEQARAVFEKDLNRRRVAEEGMLRDLFMALLAMGELITGQIGYFTKFVRVMVEQHINAGPRSPDLVRLDLEAYEAGLISKETVMARIGIEDIDGELALIKMSAPYILDAVQKAVEAMGDKFTPESAKNLLKEIGLPDNVIGTLVAAPPQPKPAAPAQ